MKKINLKHIDWGNVALLFSLIGTAATALSTKQDNDAMSEAIARRVHELSKQENNNNKKHK